MATATELPIDTGASALDMANEIFGAGITVNSAAYSGDNISSGIFTNGDTVSSGVTPSDSGVILSTGNATDFTNSSGSTNTNTSAGTSTNTTGVNGDADFNGISGGATYDASFLEIDFTPSGSVFTIDFVLSSEEFPEYNASFNDAVGVWVNGVEATVNIGNGTAAVSNITPDNSPDLYNDNTGDQYNTEMDGFTVTLTFTAPVNVGEVNTIKIGVADGGDSGYDTNLLIAGGSAQTVIVAEDDNVTVFNNAETVNVLDNDSTTASGDLTITQINGIPVVSGDSIVLSNGQTVTLNTDGTLLISANGATETIHFNYTIENSLGETDTGLVQVDNITLPCFVAGTQILTGSGSKPVEDLRVGDMVLTRDHGLQSIRWIGNKSVPASGAMAPIRITKGTFGVEADLLLSPQHKVLLSGAWAELLFAENEVLISAKNLVNDKTIRAIESTDNVHYFHLLFDAHEIIWSNGILSESYHPGPETMAGFDANSQAEILQLFPELDALTGEGYGPTARRALTTNESEVLAIHLTPPQAV
ncbi:MAG: Hint domain-containing protein [Rhodobacteraceae bacterium]|nr:Hint domain-containing protein [Paracoccaceae bacterium]